ncbi:MAG: hypothetical protein SFX18_15440 [Pirellulales bacterium]|nr:hypothetical protein [Pirellulales bacterium]
MATEQSVWPARLRTFGFALLNGALGAALLMGLPLVCALVIPYRSGGGQDWSGLILMVVLYSGAFVCGLGGFLAGLIYPGRTGVKWTLALVMVSHVVAAAVCYLVWNAGVFAAWHFCSVWLTGLIGWKFWPQPWRRLECILWVLLPYILIPVISTPEWDARRGDVEVIAALIRTLGVGLVLYEEFRGSPSRSIRAWICAILGQCAVIWFYHGQYATAGSKVLPDAITLAFMAITGFITLSARRVRQSDRASL